MIPFTIYSRREPVSVISPYDPALQLQPCNPDDVRAYHACRTLDLPAGAVLSDQPTRFRVRALSPLEVRQLRPLLPSPHPSQVERIERERADPSAPKTGPAPEEMVVLEETLRLYCRAGLVGIDDGAPDGWQGQRQERIGSLRLWPESTIEGLPDETVIWLGAVVSQLTHSTSAEQKKSSGS